MLSFFGLPATSPQLPPPRMIASANMRWLETIEKQSVDEVLFCSGGGIAAAFFTLGALRALEEQSQVFSGNRFAVVSAISGSCIPCILIERCYDLGLVGERDWFNRFVVRPIHRFFIETPAPQELMNILNIATLETILRLDDEVSRLDAKTQARMRMRMRMRTWTRGKKGKKRNTGLVKPCFLYHCVNANTGELSVDHSDLARERYPLATMIFRCVLPFSSFGAYPSLDAAACTNCPSTYVFTHYRFERVTVVSISDYYIYDRYDDSPFTSLIKYLNFSNFVGVSDVNSVNFSTTRMNVQNTTLITVSNTLTPSRDRVHNGLFLDLNRQRVVGSSDFYNIFLHDFFLICENEGHIQARVALLPPASASAKLLDFSDDIPNPSVYSARAHEIVPRLSKVI